MAGLSRSLSAAVAMVLLGSLLAAVNAQNTEFVSSACNTTPIPKHSPFFTDLSTLFDDLEQNTAFSGYIYNTQASGGTHSDATPITAYGQGICRQSLSQSQCSSCLTTLANEILSICNNGIGARVQLVDCYIRYETFSF